VNKLMTITAAAVLLGALPAQAQMGQALGPSKNKTTLAVFGDWPYSADLLSKAPQLVASVNSDPKVRLVLFVGDIHSGSMPCTGAGLVPPPPVYAPDWNTGIYDIFQQFQKPFVYTPGDNEWCDCQKKKEGDGVVGSGAPLNELGAVRDLFFARPGTTLGGQKKQVITQATAFDPAFPDDAQFVENVYWEESQVVFVTINLPGSNNDGIKWAAPYTDEAARTQEVAQRTDADLRWLDKAFDQAELDGAAGVLIGLQADMWDLTALAPGGDGLAGYTSIVTTIAERTAEFGKPVLLINGDSHVFEADQPLADPTSPTGLVYGLPSVTNLTRITVEGSTAANEWLRVTVDPKLPEVFTWAEVQYLP